MIVSKGQAIKYSPEQLSFVFENKTLARKELTRLFNEKFGTSLPQNTLSSLCKRKEWFTGRDGRYGKDNIPWNRHMSKKGKKPTRWERYPIGHETPRPDGYILVKIAEPNVRKLKHHLLWEKHYGPIPKGHYLRFKDGDVSNITIENLVCITQGANMVLNRRYKHKDQSPENKSIVITMAQIDDKVYQREKNRA